MKNIFLAILATLLFASTSFADGHGAKEEMKAEAAKAVDAVKTEAAEVKEKAVDAVEEAKEVVSEKAEEHEAEQSAEEHTYEGC